MLKDVLGELRAISGTGLAQLHAWASYETAPAIAMIVTSRAQYAFRPTRFALPADRARRWIIHDIKIGIDRSSARRSPSPATPF